MAEITTKLSLSAVVRALHKLSDNKIKQLVVHLGVENYRLENIEESHSAGSRNIPFIQAWLDIDTTASWEKIVSGLRVIGMHVIANDVAKQYCPVLLSTAPLPFNSTPKQEITTASEKSVMTVSAHTKSLTLTTSSIEEVKAAIFQLEERFTELISDTQDEISEKEKQDQRFLNRFRNRLLTLPVTQKAIHVKFFVKSEDAILAAKNTQKILTILCRYWNYRNYEILFHIIIRFCDRALKKSMLEYKEMLDAFEEGTTVDVYIRAISAGKKLTHAFSEMVVKLKKNPSECTLYEVRKLKEEIAEASSLYSHSVYIDDESIQCVVIMLRVPSSALSSVMEAITPEFMGTHCITEMIVGGHVLTVEKVHPVGGRVSDNPEVYKSHKQTHRSVDCGLGDSIPSDLHQAHGKVMQQSQLKTSRTQYTVAPPPLPPKLNVATLKIQENLKKYKWFWGEMNREVSEARMREEGEVGNFAVRINASGHFSMTFWRSDGIIHHLITHMSGIYRFRKTSRSVSTWSDNIRGKSLVEFLKSCIKNAPYKLVPIGEMDEDDDLDEEIDEASWRSHAYLAPTLPPAPPGAVSQPHSPQQYFPSPREAMSVTSSPQYKPPPLPPATSLQRHLQPKSRVPPVTGQEPSSNESRDSGLGDTSLELYQECNLMYHPQLESLCLTSGNTKSSRESEKLDNYEWFWGDMNRADCVAKMSREGKIGRFAIRINPRGSLAMTFWRSDGIYHRRIVYQLGMYRFEASAVQVEGKFLLDLLDNYIKKSPDGKIIPFGAGILYLVQAKSIRESEKLDYYQWFWGDMSRVDCVAQMREKGDVGIFAIRVNASGHFVMTLWRGNGFSHHRIIYKLGKYRFEISEVQFEGNSLVDLLDNCTKDCSDDNISPFGGELHLVHDGGRNPPDLDIDQLQKILLADKDLKHRLTSGSSDRTSHAQNPHKKREAKEEACTMAPPTSEAREHVPLPSKIQQVEKYS